MDGEKGGVRGLAPVSFVFRCSLVIVSRNARACGHSYMKEGSAKPRRLAKTHNNADDIRQGEKWEVSVRN